MENTEDKLKGYKTLCCNSEWHRKGRANYRCNKCDADVTLDILLIYQALDE